MKVIVNKVATASFLRERGIPVREALFAAVILGDKVIGRNIVAAVFAGEASPEHFTIVANALEEARLRAALPGTVVSAAKVWA